MKRFLGALSLLLSLSFPFAGTVLAQGDHYRFVMVSHIGSEANMNWSTTSMKTFDEKYPGVKTEYLSTNDYNLQSFIAILNQAIANHPADVADLVAALSLRVGEVARGTYHLSKVLTPGHNAGVCGVKRTPLKEERCRS